MCLSQGGWQSTATGRQRHTPCVIEFPYITLVHTSTNIVCNLFFDIIPAASSTKANKCQDKISESSAQKQTPSRKGSSKSSKDSVVLTDITFNHFLEDPNFDIVTLKHQYHFSSSPINSYKKFVATLKNNSRVSLKKKISKFDLYNQISKALRKKCRKYIIFGDMRGLFPKVLDIALRYMENVDKMECDICKKFLKFNKKHAGQSESETIEEMPTVEYPVLNHGLKFYHQNCCPEEIRNKIF